MTKQEQVDKLIEAIELVRDVGDDIGNRGERELRPGLYWLRAVRDRLIEEIREAKEKRVQ